jgi:hypothetical protein
MSLKLILASYIHNDTQLKSLPCMIDSCVGINNCHIIISLCCSNDMHQSVDKILLPHLYNRVYIPITILYHGITHKTQG